MFQQSHLKDPSLKDLVVTYFVMYLQMCLVGSQLVRTFNHSSESMIAHYIATAAHYSPFDIKQWRISDGIVLQTFAGHTNNLILSIFNGT